MLPTALRGAFQSCGQNCAGAERFIVQEKVRCALHCAAALWLQLLRVARNQHWASLALSSLSWGKAHVFPSLLYCHTQTLGVVGWLLPQVYDEFCRRAAEATAQLRQGPAGGGGLVDCGAMCMPGQAAKVQELVDDAVVKGAKVRRLQYQAAVPQKQYPRP